MKLFVVKEHRLVEKSVYSHEERKSTDGLEDGTALYLPSDPLEQPKLYEFSRHDYKNSISQIQPGSIVYLRGLEELLGAGQKLTQRTGKPKSSPLGYFFTEVEGLFPLDCETMFENMRDLEETDEALTYALLRRDVTPEPAQNAKDIIAKQKLCQRILDYFGKKYDLTQKVDVWASRCSGGFGPNCEKEPLGFAIFCRVGQSLHHRRPFYGKYVNKIEFEGSEELDKMMKNVFEFYPEFNNTKT